MGQYLSVCVGCEDKDCGWSFIFRSGWVGIRPVAGDIPRGSSEVLTSAVRSHSNGWLADLRGGSSTGGAGQGLEGVHDTGPVSCNWAESRSWGPCAGRVGCVRRDGGIDIDLMAPATPAGQR
jgi:hypothetical protein